MTDSLCVLLWALPDKRDALARYEDAVLALVPDHGGRVVHRVSALPSADGPDEVQILEFADEAGVQSYLADPRRLALAADRDAAVARTEIRPLA